MLVVIAIIAVDWRVTLVMMTGSSAKDHENGAVYRILPPTADRPFIFSPGFVQI